MNHILAKSFPPPPDCLEFQPKRAMKMVGRGYPVIRGQSRILIDGSFAYIHLSGDIWAIIDKDDAHRATGNSWTGVQKKRQIYATYRSPKGQSPCTVYLHRLIMNAPAGMQVDHINCNALDNRKQNLRICTASDNAKNQPLLLTNTTGFKGVHFNKSKKKFTAQIRGPAGKVIKLGYFETAISAHEAYKIASQKYHGEFGRWN